MFQWEIKKDYYYYKLNLNGIVLGIFGMTSNNQGFQIGDITVITMMVLIKPIYLCENVTLLALKWIILEYS